MSSLNHTQYNKSNKFSREIEMQGHLIDSLILTKVFSGIMDLDGEFQILEISIGKKKNDESYVKLIVEGKTQNQLDKILDLTHSLGAINTKQEEIKIETAPGNMIMPNNFYSTTNNETKVFYHNKWINVKNIMMDKCIIIKKSIAQCIPIREIKKGDKIVVGDSGIKIFPIERPRDKNNVFNFMTSNNSSERPTNHMVKKVASDIMKIKNSNGKIILVAGPAIIHTGASESVSVLIKLGLIDSILAGNALAVHDIENSILGTSLGMNIHDGTLALHGNRNHMYAINSVFQSGSIKNMVKTGKLKKGIMFECIKNNIPFVLAGSIRDDGPIPDVITDIMEAQEKYKKQLENADLVIMASTMLHSIATGNMLPAKVKVIAIDINQTTVTKIIDRGTWQALGIVSDVGVFLPQVTNEIKKIINSNKKKS
ncbi:MAG: TIGR00300 family protein [Thaumarchaeota archaeon]|nr:TIGR00300 family protein [Nitrososphaerota archaeon]MCY3975605.1 TIGR00300 family protein [Nitrososphaerota archaeon]